MTRVGIFAGPLVVSGANVAALDVAVELAARDLQVRLVAGEGPLAARFRAAGIPVRTFDLTGRLPADLPRVRELRRALLEEQIDVLHVANPQAAGLGRLLARLVRRPYVVSFTDPGLGAGAERSAWLRGIIAPSRAARDELILSRGLAKARIDEVPAAVDVRRFPCPSVPLSGSGVVLGALTRLDRTAGLPDLLEAVRLLLSGGIGLHLLVVGQGPEQEPLRRLARNMGIQKHVTVTEVPRDFERILDTVDVFVHPRHREWAGYGILHAMAAARPVVAAGVGAVYSIVREAETGYITPVGDPGTLAKRIELLLADPEQARGMGRAGRAVVEESFSVPRSVDRLLEVYAAASEGARP